MATAAAAATRTDEQIQMDVLNELKWEPRIQPNEVGVSVKDAAGGDRGAAAGDASGATKDEDVVDAEFTEVGAGKK